MLDNTQSIICAFGLASAVPRSPYRHLELCGIALGCSRGRKIAFYPDGDRRGAHCAHAGVWHMMG
ncbi:MAG: hypothetical protein WBO61_07690 [Gemmiger qucibialis]